MFSVITVTGLTDISVDQAISDKNPEDMQRQILEEEPSSYEDGKPTQSNHFANTDKDESILVDMPDNDKYQIDYYSSYSYDSDQLYEFEGIQSISYDNEKYSGSSGYNIVLDSSHHTSFNPIWIDGDSAFATMATNEGWDGDGSISTPYIITGYDITNATGNAISILNTAVYFEISDNVLHNSSGQGIYFYNVQNAVVTNNTIIGNDANGVIGAYTDNSEISSNQIIDNGNNGIHIDLGSDNNLLYKNTAILNEDYGILFDNTGTSNVADANTLVDNNRGIYVYYTDAVEVTDNNVTSNENIGILVHTSHNVILDNNNVSQNVNNGIYVYRGDNSAITNNQIFDNGYHGIKTYDSEGHTITDNIAYRNRDGISLDLTNTTSVSNNLAYGNQFSGIALFHTGHFLNVLDNIATNNTTNGLYFNNMYSSTVANNHAFENGDNGIIVISGDTNTVEYNNLTDNFGSGIRLSSTTSNTVQHNIFTQDGFQMQGSLYEHYQQTVFDNNTANGSPIIIIENTVGTLPTDFAQLLFLNVSGVTISGESFTDYEMPIAFAFSNNIIVENNVISHSTGSGLVFQHVNDSIVRNNIIDNSRWDAVLFNYAGYNNLIENNELYNSTFRGIFLIDVDFSTITGNDIHNNGHDDLALVRSHNTTVTNNIVYDGGGRLGIIVDASQNTTLINNDVYNHDLDGIRIFQGSHNAIISGISSNRNGWSGLYVENSDNIKILSSEFLSNSGYGAREYQVDNSIIQDSIASHNGIHGFSVDRTNNVTISGNTAINNTNYGFAVRVAPNAIVTDNVSAENQDGITLWSGSDDSIVKDNTVTDNKRVGIHLLLADNINVTDNLIQGSVQHGIYLSTSEQNNVVGNELINDGMYVIAATVSKLYQGVVANNTVNGKPLVFIQQKDDGTIVEKAGQVIVIDSSHIKIEGLNLSNTTTGALIRHSEFVTFSGNIVGNTSYYGVILNQQTNNSVVVGNSFFTSGLGFRITSQAVDHGWDNYFGYNYWENGSKVDVDFDGISEVPYFIDGEAENRDETPLTYPYSVVFVEVLDNDTLSQEGKKAFFEEIPPEILYGGGVLAFLALSGGSFAVIRRFRRRGKGGGSS